MHPHGPSSLALGENSFLYTDNGKLLGVVPSATNRQPLPLSQIAPSLPQATVAIEDARFWQHGALDYRGIARAPSTRTSRRVTSCRAARRSPRSSSGTSTSATRSERCRGRSGRPASPTKVFQKNTRKQILADYLNEVFYGRHAYGAQAAARTYFSKPASKLTLVQAALLAGLPQAPSVYDPLSQPARRARPAERGAARDVEERLHHRGRSCASATHKGLQLRPGHLYTQLHQPNFFGWATQQLADRFGDGQRQVELGGLQVKTTLNTRLQGLASPCGHLGPAHGDRPRRGGRRDRPADRRREGDGRLPPERPGDAVQPRDPGPPLDGQLLQADHARDRAERGRLPLLDLLRSARAQHHHAGVHAEQRALGRPQLRRRGGRAR